MARKYTFADVNTEEKPVIAKCLRQFGEYTYTWRCSGRGSEGFGTTPGSAYSRWSKNWTRRFRFYKSRADGAANYLLAMATRQKSPVPDDEPIVGKVCKFCGADGLHWGYTERGWRLYAPDEQMHLCYMKDRK